jgi:hypothetical protein
VRLQGKTADTESGVDVPREERRMPDQNGDRLLGDLARERGSALTSYAYLLTGDVAAAQDLVQDALVKVFVRTRKGFTPRRGGGVRPARRRRVPAFGRSS